MLTHEMVENFLLMAGFTEPSLVEMRPKYDRIIRRMHECGFDDLGSDMAVSQLTLIVHQMRLREARDAAAEHHLRNLTGVRQGRRWKK
ncbi:MAG: hypothetical protein ACYCTL_13310 [Acidimicrobiales bacterium]